MRIERDSMGEVSVPDDAYYGASTQRAVDNFPISDLRFGRRFIWALGLIKGSAAEMNKSMGIVDADKADAIIEAAEETSPALGRKWKRKVDALLAQPEHVWVSGLSPEEAAAMANEYAQRYNQ